MLTLVADADTVGSAEPAVEMVIALTMPVTL